MHFSFLKFMLRFFLISSFSSDDRNNNVKHNNLYTYWHYRFHVCLRIERRIEWENVEELQIACPILVINEYEELHLGYNAVQSVENQQPFRVNMSPSSSGPKYKLYLVNTSRRFLTLLVLRHWLLPASFWFLAIGLFFDPDDGDVFLRNVSWPLTDNMTLYPRR
jgi:hypothetical protein